MQQVYFSSIVVVCAVFSHLYECGFLTPFICSFILNTQVGWMKIEVLTEVWQKMFQTNTIWGTIPRQVLEQSSSWSLILSDVFLIYVSFPVASWFWLWLGHWKFTVIISCWFLFADTLLLWSQRFIGLIVIWFVHPHETDKICEGLSLFWWLNNYIVLLYWQAETTACRNHNMQIKQR